MKMNNQVEPVRQHAESRSAEKRHLSLLEDVSGLAAKPFLAGTSLSVDRAACEIAVFAEMVNNITGGPGSLVLDLGAGTCWVSDWLQKLLYRTVSLDLSEDMLREGRCATIRWTLQSVMLRFIMCPTGVRR